jgi:hypothetical protein
VECDSGSGVTLTVGTQTLTVCDGASADPNALAALEARVAELQDIVDVIAPPKLVFVTSLTYTGNLGGPLGADAICAQLANDAGLTGRQWTAWISSINSSVLDRWNGGFTPYRMLDGRLVATGLEELITSGPRVPININEYGVSVVNGSEQALVWTGTSPTGSWSGLDCGGWTDDARSEGNEGDVGSVELAAQQLASEWTLWGTTGCHTSRRLYCFERQLRFTSPGF